MVGVVDPGRSPPRAVPRPSAGVAKSGAKRLLGGEDRLNVGRSPDGPLGVMGRYEFVTEFNGNKVANFQAHNRFGTTKAESEDVTKSLRVVGAFGADLP